MGKEQIAYNKGYRINKDGTVIGLRGKPLSLHINSNGYKAFTIRLNNHSFKRSIKVHRFQAYNKFGEDLYKDGFEVRHLNNDKLDNSYDNISIGTRSQNHMDKDPETRRRVSCNANKKYPNEMVEEMRALNKRGYSYSYLMSKYGISSKGTISHIINKRLDL